MIRRAVYAIPAVGLMWAGCGGIEGPDPKCGDAFTDADEGEQCDDGNEEDGDSCTNACTVAQCGDGITENGAEACDDGNNVDGDDCTNACEAVRCGDGVVADQANAREACDDENTNETDGCLSTCEIDPVIRAFTITKHQNLEPTSQYTHYFQSGYNSTFCSRAFDSPVSISMALVVSGSYTRTRDCADNTEDNVVTRAITGTAQVLIARQKYAITLTEAGGGPIILDCDMDSANKLTCVDNAAQPTNWELTAQ